MSDPIAPKSSSADLSKKSPSNKGASIANTSGEIQETQVYSAHFVNLDHVREFVGAAARKCGLDDSAIYATQLAADEAFTNIIEHAYGGECEEKIECTCLIKETGIAIVMRDCGHPFDPALVPEPDLEADLEDRAAGGLGLFFIHQLMDEVEFTFTHEAETGKLCNVLRMVKHKEH